ncbi:PhzF family phenazine biosynthesis protein [Paenibacillus marinisediminis]
MPTIQVYQYDAFTSEPNKGNPAGVVLNADHLSAEDMQEIAFKVGFNETVFVLKSEQSDLRLRYFTPGHEMNLCGHATVGALYALSTRGLLEAEDIMIETKAGILPIKLERSNDQLTIKMKQNAPQFLPFQGDVDELAASIGLRAEDIDQSKPIVYGSTGIWTLIVPIRTLSAFVDMKPNNHVFPELCSEVPKASLHPITFETYDPNALMHARHFSSPYSGTVEDPVTGTASGVMGAYVLTFLDHESASLDCVVEQGIEIGRDGKVIVQVVRHEDSMDVFIAGTAVFVQEMQVEY